MPGDERCARRKPRAPLAWLPLSKADLRLHAGGRWASARVVRRIDVEAEGSSLLLPSVSECGNPSGGKEGNGAELMLRVGNGQGDTI